MSEYYLGIDTSNYKTSVAIIDNRNNTVFNKSEFLDVKQGERGLRQSTAFFLHSNRLPEYLDEAFRIVEPSEIKAIGVSTRPRRVEGSYMPCFLAGYNAAREISSALEKPVFEFSHQEGHAASVINDNENKFIMFHLSGGTTEFLFGERDSQGYNLKIEGGTEDISIGQLLDRLGVSMGLHFPSGKYLDEIAFSKEYDKTLISRIKYENYKFNLSGLETKLIRLSEDNSLTDTVVSTLFYRLAELLYSASLQLSEEFGISNVYFVGGVSSSKTIRRHICDFQRINSENNTDNQKLKIIFGEPELSGDNAIGIARLAQAMKEK